MILSSELGRRLGKSAFSQIEPDLRLALLDVQTRLAETSRPVIVVLEGDDRAGCHDAIVRLREWMDPRHLVVHAMGPPHPGEAEYPPFWRYWRALPPGGRIGIFSHAWVTRALVCRLRDELNDNDLDRRLEHVRSFERALVDDGALMIKIWLHLPKKELRRRLQGKDRQDRWSWRMDDADLLLLDHHDEAMDIAERVLERTEHGTTLWHVVESTDPHHRDVELGRLLLDRIGHHLEARTADTEHATDVEATAPSGTPVLDHVDMTRTLERNEYEERLLEEQTHLHGLFEQAQRKRRSTVVAFEGWDAAGKGGCIRRLVRAVDPRDYRIVPVAAPTAEELAHHWLWRFWKHIPRTGEVTLFDRSWYGRVLVERVEGYASRREWTRAYGEIVDFETQLVHAGVLVVKCWLHVDADVQLERFHDRERSRVKRHKLTPDDWRNREKRPEYLQAANEMIERTGTEDAPWTIVAANNKRWARVRVLRTVRKALQRALDS